MSDDHEAKDVAKPAGADPDETVAGETAELEGAASRPDETERRPATEPAPARETGDADLRDVAGALGSYLRGRVVAAAGLVRSHRLATALVALAVAAIAVTAVALATAGQGLPSTELIERDALERLATPEYSGGSFGRDDILVPREVEVRSVRQGEDSAHALAEVLVTYAGSSVRAERSATLGFVRGATGWVADGEPSDVRVSWQTLADPDPNKVVSNVSVLLAQADRQLEAQGQQDDPTLEQLYADGEASLDRFEYDPEKGTCAIEVTCTREGAFESYECRLSAGLAFRSGSGQWELERLSVSDGGKTRSLEPLVGTWSGAFVRQQTDGTKCLAGRSTDLSLRIETTSTQNGVSQVAGYVSGVAHYHAHPAQDSTGCTGDLAFSDVPVTATLTDDADGTLVLETTLPEDVDGTVSITLRLGEKDDPSAATAEVTTTYPHTGSFLFIPYEETLSYTDVYALARATDEA